MRIHFLGAAQTVTGSQYLLEINGQRLLLECGFFQGKREASYTKNLHFSYDPRLLDAVILSHAHIDHSGNLPNLVKQGYSGPIYTTPATAKLADIMLQDSGKIQEADVLYANKKRARRGEEPVEPIYTIEDAARVKDHFRPMPYGQTFEPVSGVQAKLVDAGHILGSAAVVLDINEKGKSFRFWFSGDIGRRGLPLLKDPVMPDRAEYLMMECTYGDKPQDDPQMAYADLKQTLQKTFERGGKVIIPAFAVGRTQELVYEMNQMFSRGEVRRVPVFVDSPLAVAASKIFQQFPDLYDEETRQFVVEGRHPALNFPGLTYVSSVEESKSLNDRREPMVIISASGMAEAGRILHHLRNNIENPRNTILIVSWQAPDTLGRRLVEGEKIVRIFGQVFERKAEIVTIDGFSAHAHQPFLLEYAASSQKTLNHIFLVHNEIERAEIFKNKLAEAGQRSVSIPFPKDVVEV